MSFLSRLFKKKKEDTPAPPIKREPPKSSASQPRQETRKTAPTGAAVPQAVPPQAVPPQAVPPQAVPPQPEPSVTTATAPLGSNATGNAAPFHAAKTEQPLKPIIESEHDASEQIAEVTQAMATPADAPTMIMSVADLDVAGFIESETQTAPLESQTSANDADTFAATTPLGAAGDFGDGFFDDLLDDFDANFDAAIGGGPAAAVAASAEAGREHGVVVDQTPVRELFADIAANYVRAVRNFMLEVHRGDTAKEWIDICQPAVHSIKRAAEKMELEDVHRAIEDFDAVLDLASSQGGRLISGEARDELIATYDMLIHLLPQAFTLDAERDQRESIMIHSILLQLPDVRKVTVDKLYAAGLTTLEVFFLAKPEDLAATAGIPDWLAGKIVDKFQAYRAEMQAVSPDASRSAERGKLASLVESLKGEQEAYERASSGWTEDAAEEKKRLRQARQETLLQIQVVLAQLGEVDLIHELEKLPFERRIDRLAEFLDAEPKGDVPL
jgi:hypothetical protein